MSALLSRLLRPRRVEGCLRAAVALAGGKLRVTVVADGAGVVAAAGPDAAPDGSAPASAPLLLEGARQGAVVVESGEGAALDAERRDLLAQALAVLLQALLDAEHGRRAVAAETLAAYRDMALVHRAALDLNNSLNPAAVASVLLDEFCGRKGLEARVGAVWLRDEPDCDDMDRIASAGPEAEAVFAACEGWLADVFGGRRRGIVNDVDGPPTRHGLRAMLAVPLQAHERTHGVLVLLDRRDFPAADLKRAETLASIAGTALHNAQLFADQKQLFQALVDTIGEAIDAKSAYTSGHCRRVPVLARMLAEAACAADDGPLAGFRLEGDGWEALDLAAALHDCGKLVTPEWVMDKSTKLQTVHDRMHEVAARFAVLERDAEVACWRAIAEGSPRPEAEAALAEARRRLADDLAFLRACNTGGEGMTADMVARIKAIAARSWWDANGEERPLLSDDEVENLCIPRGTLLPRERKIIEDHVAMTERMLSNLPFKGVLRRVPALAASHHERLDGKGYPKGLAREQLSVEARILALADVFEALTAPDRPYRRGASVSGAVAILTRLAEEGHVDPDLLRLMLERNIHVDYARAHVRPEQVDV